MARATGPGGRRPKTAPIGRKPAGKRRVAGPGPAKRGRKALPIAKDGAEKAKARPPRRASRKPASTVGRLHQVALKASDLEAAIIFYRDVLGLPFIARFEPPGLAFFDLAGTRLMLSPTASEGTLYFAVADLAAGVGALEARGVSFAQPPALVHRDEAGTFGRKGGEEWMAFFRDPSGNLLGLAARR